MDGTKVELSKSSEVKQMHELNTILYGPPGTGKTYNTAVYAVAIIENKSLEELRAEDYSDILKRYNQFKNLGQIAFTTFHQSYGYEEFIEGIKPKLNDENSSEIQYEIADGIFKKFCKCVEREDLEFKIWNVRVGGERGNKIREDCLKNNRIRVTKYKNNSDSPNYHQETNGHKKLEEMNIGDYVLILNEERNKINNIGKITGDVKELKEKSYEMSREVEWLEKNIDVDIEEYGIPSVVSINQSINQVNELDGIDKVRFLNRIKAFKNYVFIIDEINRGNISKILGELITLMEPTKRLGANEAMTVTLPYSQENFGVPDNVYILGTMNTADRSIALMDTALRRRFQFIEMLPDTKLLANVFVENIDIEQMVEMINKRIEVLYDREHTIGHAYFMSLKDDPSITNLARIFENAILPLIQEYFYEDYSKIQLILGDNAKQNEHKFILDKPIQNVFNGNPDIDLPEYNYEIQFPAFHKKESYLAIYE